MSGGKIRTSTATHTLRLLGGFGLRDEAGNVVTLRMRKSRLLLSVLATQIGTVQSRRQLATMLWGDRADPQARGSLRNALSDIRSAIGTGVLTGQGDEIGVREGKLATDCDKLARYAEGDVTGYGLALPTIYPGAFLSDESPDSDEFAAWIEAQRTKYRGLAVKFLRGEITRLEQQSPDLALERARELLSLDTLSEESHRTLMRLYATAGERSLALAQFRNCCALLQRELGVAPSRDTRDLADRIAYSDPAVTADLTDTVAAGPGRLPSTRPFHADNDRSVVVLPFANLGGDAQQDFFGDGLTEDIATDLARTSTISVIAPSATVAYRGSATPPEQIAAQFRARYYLDGSVRRHDNSLRITTRLVDGVSGRQIWAERFDREMVNVFDVQDEIAGSVVSALRGRLVPGAEDDAGRRGTQSVPAYREYLHGRAFLAEMTRRSVELSQQMFQRAVALDPSYGQAYAGLAEAAAMLALQYFSEGSGIDLALEHCARALEIDPRLAAAHAAKGRVLAVLGRSEEAERSFRAAIELDTRSHEAHLYLGVMRLLEGRATEALSPMRLALSLQPNDLHVAMMTATTFHATGEADDLGRAAEHCLGIAQRRLRANPHDDRAAYAGAYALAELARSDEARQWLALAVSFDVDDSRTYFNLACVYSLLGDIDQSLEYLRRTLATTNSERKILYARFHCPDFQNARADPRFDELFPTGTD